MKQLENLEINGCIYNKYEGVNNKSLDINKNINVYLLNCDCCEIINNTDNTIHVMYTNSTILGKVKGNNKYVLDVYQKKSKAEFIHVFIEPNSSETKTHIPQTPFSIVGGSKY